MKKAVLLVSFNRLEYTKKVFEQIVIAKPPRLYLASDGPRTDKDGESEVVESVRKYLLDNIDWDCDIKTRFLEINSGGCGQGVSGAVTWFFENEEDGIILEDDCVPSQSFFYFCEELLDYYKEDKRVWHIAGYNPLNIVNIKYSYFFIKNEYCWGWASWANRWSSFNIDLSNYNEKHIKKISHDMNVRKYWLDILNKMKNQEIDSWAYPYTFCIIKHNGMCINPSKNLVSNIGVNGVHYKNAINSHRLNTNTYSIKNIIHPKKIRFNKHLIYRVCTEYFNIIFEKEELLNNVDLLLRKSNELENSITNINISLEDTNTRLYDEIRAADTKLEETRYNVNWIKLFGIYNNRERLKIVIFGISIVLKINEKNINKIAWWIPVKNWRDSFRMKFI